MSDIVEHVRAVLESGGIEVNEVRELPTGLGWQVRGAGGEIVSVYKTGKTVAQGKRMAEVKALLDAAPIPAQPKAAAKAVMSASKEQPQPARDGTAEAFVPRYPPGWSWEPWDGVTVPF